MIFFRNKKFIAALAAVALCIGASLFIYLRGWNSDHPLQPVSETPAEKENFGGPQYEVIGLSVESRKIEAYTYGKGEIHLAFIGGIHGGYEWNSVLLAYKFIDYLNENLTVVPVNLKVTVIPAVNPDGVYKAIGKEGRFAFSDAPKSESVTVSRLNAHSVDLNRNFGCKWKSEGVWRGNSVSAGSGSFSEPEAAAIRDFIVKNVPKAVVFWHSKSNGVYASECENGILGETIDIMNAYSRGSGYPAFESFDAYEITGDSEGWLASIGIPAITVELQTHETVEWERNLKGIKALFEYYSAES